MGPKFAITALMAAPALLGAIWPEQLGQAKRISVRAVPVRDDKLWGEYGFQDAEQAEYDLTGKKFRVTAWRLADSTGAMAVFQWQRPADAKPSKLAKLGAESAGEVLLAYGNYVLKFEDRKPDAAEIAQLGRTLPRLEQSPLPALPEALPAGNLVPNSQRYVVGPVSLEKFEPRISPSLAALHLGVEAQLGSFRTPNGEMKLAVFNYPTPSLARERLAEFQKAPGFLARRTGALVAVMVNPPNADDAERLLAQVKYQASITWSQYVPGKRDNIGDLIVNVFMLIGVLLVFAVVAGLAIGGFRVALRRGKQDPDAMISLDLKH